MGRAQEHMEMRRVTTEIFFADVFSGGVVIAAQATQRGWYPIVHSVEVDLV